VIGKDKLVVPPTLQPYMAIGFGVTRLPIVGSLIGSENEVLVFNPDIPRKQVDFAALLLLLGFDAHGDACGRRGNHFSNRIIRRVRQ
jgi:hypothetical protein